MEPLATNMTGMISWKEEVARVRKAARKRTEEARRVPRRPRRPRGTPAKRPPKMEPRGARLAVIEEVSMYMHLASL